MEHDFSMNKLELKQTILGLLQQKWSIAQNSVQRAIESATDEETVPEHKYDTLALEASYLAHGQAMRVQECEQEIRTMSDLVLPTSPDKVTLGTLVTAVDLEDKEKTFFVAPCAGGLKVNFGGEEVVVVTFESPLGRSLKGKSVGDEVSYQVSDTTFSYEIDTIS
jgi:transcription elongation GreA/GreB family factor